MTRAADTKNRRERSLELWVFLFLVFPSLVFSFFAVRQGTVSFLLTAIATILRDLSLISLILFFIWRNREPVIAIGWTARRIWKETSIGIWLFIPLFFASSALENWLHKAGLSAPSTPLPALTSEKGPAEFLLAFLLVVVVAVAEETIFRGYLILRFKAVTSSPAAAVLLSAVIFSLGHGYEGTASVVTIGVMGAVLALVYLWRKSLAAPIVMHFLQDFTGIVLVPLLKQFKFIN
ncbi:MAG: type II CAAX endopeptidase family protein [Nitrospiraceae bacterium]|nr:type II CAAX endopeptidase family protein [Nitrospiraceae bacterium]